MSQPESPLHDRMIFLVGAMRSGTNWLQRVVGAHPDVALVPSETYLFSHGIKQLRERFHHGVLGSPGTGYIYMDQKEMVRSLRELCDRVFLPYLEASPGAKRLAERTPQHVGCIDVIGEIYPDAPVVHIVRDGRDVARSLAGQRYGPSSIEAAAVEWRDAVAAGETAGRAHPRYRTIRYEELLADPRRRVTELYEWLGLPATPKIVDAALIEAEVRFNVDARAPTIGAGKWREEFTPEDLAVFLRVAGPTLEALGYDTAMSVHVRTVAPPPAPGPDRSILRRLKDRRHRRRSARLGDEQMIEHQRLGDRVVEAITTRRLDRLRELVGDPFYVRIVGLDEDWSGRGNVAWERLEAAVRDDPAFEGRQTMGDINPGVPTTTAVLTFAGSDGVEHTRTFVASFRDGRLSRLTCYRFPVARDGGKR